MLLLDGVDLRHFGGLDVRRRTKKKENRAKAES